MRASEVEHRMSGAGNLTMEDGAATFPNAIASAPKFIVARQSTPITPFRLLVWFWRAVTHIRKVREVLAFIAKVPILSAMTQSNPRFGFKFLTDDYLARGFTVSECAACFLHHYKRLNELLPPQFLRPILEEEITLHIIPDRVHRFALTMGLSRPYDNEGELTLRLRVEGEIVYVLSFTIVPGWVAASAAGETLLITRLQGIRGCFPQIGIATRAMHDVAPVRLLLAALQGVADAFGIPAIAAVPAERQTSYKNDSPLAFYEAYDNFFSELGLSKSPAGFFYADVPIPDKPLASIKRGHRLRARKKRAFRLQIQQACTRFLVDSQPSGPVVN
jgi:uncharacterized protein VirK/YbjX